jgi:hypothetical protein
MRSFGVPQFGPDDNPLAKEGEQKWLGLRPYTEQEMTVIKQLGGVGLQYHAFFEFTDATGIDRKFARQALLNTHVTQEAFGRMWVLFPELTEYLMDKCLDKVDEPQGKQIDEELFVAYALMSKLVNENDRDATRKGQDDDWALCH